MRDKDAKLVRCVRMAMSKAGQRVLSFYTKEYLITSKNGTSPITEADLDSHDILTAELKHCLPCPVFSEEDATRQVPEQQRIWLVDPLDGTKDFIAQTGDFSIMVALIENGKSVAGFVHAPLSKKFYYAVAGQGAFLDDGKTVRRLHVSQEQDITKQSMFVSRFHRREPELALQRDLEIGQTVTMGSSGLKLCAIAEGCAHIYLNSSAETGIWDVAAGKVILEEAGGIVTDMFGSELEFDTKDPFNAKGFLASNNVAHGRLIETLARALPRS